MKTQLTNKDIRKRLLKNNNFVFYVVMICFLFFILLFWFVNKTAFIILGFCFCGFIIAFIIYIIYKIILFSDDNNWYISKEVITIAKDMGDSDSTDLRVLLYDNQLVSIKSFDFCYGDTIYVIRRYKNSKPCFIFSEKEFDYIGDKKIFNNTDKYGKEYFLEKVNGKRIPVNDETHEYNEDGTKFVVTSSTKQDKEYAKKFAKYYVPIMLILVLISSTYYYFSKKDMRENWIYTTATIESMDSYQSGDEYKHKFGIVYEIEGEEYHSYIITSHGSVFEIGYKIKVYVNPKDLEEAKCDKWEPYK